MSFSVLKMGKYTPAVAAVLRVQSSAVRASRAHQTLTGCRAGNMFAKRLQRLLFDDRRQHSEASVVFYSSYLVSTCTLFRRRIHYYFCWVYCHNYNYRCNHTVPIHITDCKKINFNTIKIKYCFRRRDHANSSAPGRVVRRGQRQTGKLHIRPIQIINVASISTYFL